MTEKQYCEQMETEQLKELLRIFCNGSNNLCANSALIICQVLSERDENYPDVYEMLRKLCCTYLE